MKKAVKKVDQSELKAKIEKVLKDYDDIYYRLDAVAGFLDVDWNKHDHDCAFYRNVRSAKAILNDTLEAFLNLYSDIGELAPNEPKKSVAGR